MKNLSMGYVVDEGHNRACGISRQYVAIALVLYS